MAFVTKASVNHPIIAKTINFKTMKKVIQFGENVEGYNIPVLNEREIRASAGILFLGLIISLMEILYRSDFLPVKYFITIFLTDFAIRVDRITPPQKDKNPGMPDCGTN